MRNVKHSVGRLVQEMHEMPEKYYCVCDTFKNYPASPTFPPSPAFPIVVLLQWILRKIKISDKKF